MDQLNYSCPADRPLMKANEPNILVKCLHTVIPLIYASCLDAVEKDVFMNSLDDYKVPLCVCVRACVHVHTILKPGSNTRRGSNIHRTVQQNEGNKCLGPFKCRVPKLINLINLEMVPNVKEN